MLGGLYTPRINLQKGLATKGGREDLGSLCVALALKRQALASAWYCIHICIIYIYTYTIIRNICLMRDEDVFGIGTVFGQNRALLWLGLLFTLLLS